MEVVQQGDQFAVVISNLTNEAAALAVRASVTSVNEGASVVDLSKAGPSGEDAQVPMVYGLPEKDGLRLLAEGGFTNVVVWRVRSGSVEPGSVRQLVLNDGSALADEAVVVDAAGVIVESLPVDTPLAIKISREED